VQPERRVRPEGLRVSFHTQWRNSHAGSDVCHRLAGRARADVTVTQRVGEGGTVSLLWPTEANPQVLSARDRGA
jgi:hypothetical protein